MIFITIGAKRSKLGYRGYFSIPTDGKEAITVTSMIDRTNDYDAEYDAVELAKQYSEQNNIVLGWNGYRI